MLSEDIQKKIDSLPRRIGDIINSAGMVDVVIGIDEKFGISQDQVVGLNGIILSVFLREIHIEDISARISESLGVERHEAEEISLILLSELFYLAHDFFPGIDDEIVRLGGKIPKGGVALGLDGQFTKREEEIEAMQRQEEEEREQEIAVATVYGKITELLVKFPDLGEQLIGSQQSIEVSGLPVPMKPMVKYWIHDYKEKTGHGNHSNLERVQYVCHDKNTRSMNSEERRQLMMILKSADNEIDLPYSPRLKKIDFSLIPEE